MQSLNILNFCQPLILPMQATAPASGVVAICLETHGNLSRPTIPLFNIRGKNHKGPIQVSGVLKNRSIAALTVYRAW